MSDTSKIVLITGASKGLGQGIARHFGSAGATVYLTSRPSSSDQLAKVAAEVEAAGGKAISLSVDHTDSEQVKGLIEQIRADSSRLDILINNAAAVHPQLAQPGTFWEKPIELAEMIKVPLYAAYITTWHAAPLMVEARSGLIANISFYGAVSYQHAAAYGAAKAGTDKMSFDMAADLRPHNVASVSIWPGMIYSQAVAQWVENTPADQIPASLKQNLPLFERPEFTGRVIEALHNDTELMSLSGQALIGAELGTRYGITDIDGKQPISYRDSMGAPIAFFTPPQG